MVELGPGGSVDHIVIEHPAQAGLDVHELVSGRAVILAGAVVILGDMLTDGHAGGVFVRQAIEILDEIEIHVIVGIDAGDILPCGVGDPVVAGIGQAAVFLVQSLDAGVLARVPVAHGAAAVGRTVIDHQDLEIVVGLVQNGLHAAVEVCFYIVNWKNNRDQRSVHPVFPPWSL